MATSLTTPGPGELERVLAVLSSWQTDDAPLHLHPGDVGWHHARGAERTAADLRVWSRDGRPLAVGMLDGRDLLRTAVDPDRVEDPELAATMAGDLADPGRGVLPAGEAFVEASSARRLRRELTTRGWTVGDPWVPLRRDLTAPVEDPGLDIECVGPGTVREYTAVHRSAFAGDSLTDERFTTLTAGPAYAEAVSLIGRDANGTAVAVITVWSAGPGRPGLIEPLGVHQDHRGHGYGRALCVAGASSLRAMGASSAAVCTPRSLTGAVATYLSAGFRRFPDVPDLQRSATA
ncbi:GNAT family N-acetyltransferase [Brachybacterium sacelli]|uniref:N-acetyltransferase YhbS n=1 Tax=Brachybacterium sacelli TaxID=173364 RepID=A0ABS4X4M8_9MICO|nr:GNAT family N-acetyltransferase [Brachybacterium sacelli]MBP2383420.1 putative N-acetyltransferase YhbS [Brachybacterium sacelli]